ncbi:MAG: SPFH domain-containing protein [Salinivirgaceae bacterium]|nr:SPFH domain-containing protein [Salinivirgaceae bacterium]
MNLIDFAKSDSRNARGNVFAYRYPETNLSTNTQIVVHESEEAFFFSQGKLMGKFGPGKHTLSTENLPLLRSFFKIPFGGNNPFTAEVWIVNKLIPADLIWKIDGFTIHDPDFDTTIPLCANGKYSVQIVDAERFLINMVGKKDNFTESDLTRQSQGEFTSKAKSAILRYMIENHIGYKQISGYIDYLSDFLKESITPFWSNYGIDMPKFFIESVEIDTSTKEGREIVEAIAKQADMKLTGRTWQQERAFDITEKAFDQIGKMGGQNGGLLGSLMALNMMNNMQGSMGGAMINPQYNQPSFGAQGGVQNVGQQGMAAAAQQSNKPKTIFCSNCSKKRLSTERFCPNCGTEYNPCPRCGADNRKNAKRCVSCGTQLGSADNGASLNTCTNCGTPLAAGAAFCSVCGKPVATADPNVCPRCGVTLQPSAVFCPSCGFKRQ